MSNRVVISADGLFGYTQGGSTMVRLNLGAAAAGVGGKAGERNEAPTTPAKKPESGDFVPWGDDNLFPQAVIKDIESNTVLPSTLEKKTSMMYGAGLMYGIVTGYNADGSEQFKRLSVPEIEAFVRGSRLNRYGFEAIQDLNIFANAFAELIVSKDRKTITGISIQEAAWCRYQKPKKGVSPGIYINANWDNGGKADDEYSTPVPLLDPYYDAVGALQARTDGFKYIYPLFIPSSDKALYQLASWNALRRSGWLDVAKSIPEFKKALFKNQLSVKYLITIHSAYWEWKYGDWEGLSRDERVRLISEELTAFEATMSGTAGAAKTVMSTTILDKLTNQQVQAFQIEAIDDKLKDGLYVEDSAEASSHIYTALGVAPSLMGVSPGKGMGAGAGGGSEPRVLFNNFVSTSRFWLDLVTEPLDLISAYNNWMAEGQLITWRFLNPYVMTQADSKPAQQESK